MTDFSGLLGLTPEQKKLVPDRQDPMSTIGFDGKPNRVLELQADQIRHRVDDFVLAAKNDPELAARALDAGIDLEVAQRDPASVGALLKQQDYHNALTQQSSPTLWRMLNDPDFAAIAHDDARNLANADSIAAHWNAGRAITRRGHIGKRIADAIYRGETPAQADVEELAAVEKQLALLPREYRGGWLGWLFTGAAKTLGQQFEDADLVLGTAATTATVGSFVPGVGTAFGAITGTVAGFAGSSFAVEAGNHYLDSVGADALGMTKEQALAMGINPGLGVDPALAHKTAVGVGIVNAGLEVAGGRLLLGTFFRKQAQRELSKRLAREALTTPGTAQRLARLAVNLGKGVGGEIATEVAQEFSNIVGENIGIAGTDPSQLDQEAVDNRPSTMDRLMDIMEETVRGVLLIGSVGPAFNLYRDTRRAAQAEQTQQFVEALSSNVQESKVNKRSEARHEEFLEQAHKNGAVESVFFDVEEFQTAMGVAGVTHQDLRASHPQIADRFEEGRNTGSVEVPTHTFGARFLAQPLGQALGPDLRIEPEAASVREMEQLQTEQRDELLQQAEQAIERELEEDNERRAALSDVAKQTSDQVKETGRFTPEQANHAAAVYRAHVDTMSRELGMTVEEYLEKRGVTDSTTGEKRGLKIEPLSEPKPPAPVDRSESAEAGLEQAVPEDQTEQTQPEERKPLVLNSGKKKVRGRYAHFERLIQVGADADFLTLMHEMSHAFLNEMLDLAQEGLATPRMLNDLDTVLVWASVPGKDAASRRGSFKAMRPEDQTKIHEKFAVSFERYIYEGKAPTKALQKVFNKFRRWALAAYTAMRRTWNQIHQELFGENLPALTDDVRRVMDRMLAAFEEVEVTERERGMLPMFGSLEQFLEAGFTEQEWTTYQEALQEARDAAVTDLTKASMKQMRWLKNARSRIAKEVQKKAAKERKRIEEEIEQDLLRLPEYRALAALRDADREGKLNLDTVRKIVERSVENLDPDSRTAVVKETMKRLGTHKRGVTAKGGADPDAYAGHYGYESGEQMVRALAFAPPIETAVEIQADTRMAREHGDLVSPDEVERIIDEALHSEARARFLRIELAFLQRSGGPVRAQQAAADFAAEQALGKRLMKDLKPRNFSRQEAAAARRAEAALASGDMEAAIKAKAEQLMANTLTRKAIEAAQEVSKLGQKVRHSALRPDKKISKTHDMDLVNTARILLGAIGMAPPSRVDRATEQMQILAQADSEKFARLSGVIAAAPPIDAGHLTVDEFRTRMTVAEGLMFEARRTQQIQLLDRKAELDAVVDQLVAALDAPETKPGQVQALTKNQRRSLNLIGTRGNLTKIEHLFRALDGGKTGVFLSSLWDPLREALNNYRAEALIVTQRVLGITQQMRDAPTTATGKIEATELGYTFGNGNGGLGIAELVGALLHTGNTSNKERLVGAGRGLNREWGQALDDGSVDFRQWDKFIERMVNDGVLAEAHFEFAQQIWDLLEQIKPTLQNAHRSLTGVFFREVPADEFTVVFPNGNVRTFRGGYVPAAADPDLVPTVSQVKTQEELRGEFKRSMPSTPSGFTQERVAGYRGRALTLDVMKVAAHVDEALRYAHVQPHIADVSRILNNEKFAASAGQRDRHLVETLTQWLERAATQTLYNPGKDRTADGFWKFIRRNTGIAIMALNPVNTLQQITGISNSFNYVKRGYLAHGIKVFMSGQGGKLVRQHSKFMDERMENQVFGLRADLQELLNENGWVADAQNWTIRHAYWTQSKVQNVVDIVTWVGSFEQNMAELPDNVQGEHREKRAAREADRAVRLAQGSFNPEDVANYEAGSPWWRTWTQFTGYFNTVLNQVLFSTDNKLRAAIISFSIPLIISEAINKTLRNDWDSEDDGFEDDLSDVFLLSQLRGLGPLVPAFGPAVAGVIEGATSDRPLDSRSTASSASLSQLYRSVIGVVRGFQAVANDRELKGRTARDILNALTLSTGLPFSVAGRPVQFLVDTEGDENALQTGLGLLSGSALR